LLKTRNDHFRLSFVEPSTATNGLGSVVEYDLPAAQTPGVTDAAVIRPG
jgi:hypothetical protein